LAAFGVEIENLRNWAECNTLGFMDIADWRTKIDELDRRLVELLSERARAAVEIGRLKRDTNLPVYEPERERVVFENVQQMNPGPLPGRDLVRIYERIMDVMRNVQKEEIGMKMENTKAGTELDSEVND
jgi:chorismate mutase-like protein